MTSEAVQFLNLDLEVEAADRPNLVADHLQNRCDVLYDGACENGTRLAFEPGILCDATILQCIEYFLELLEAMPSPVLEEWYRCKVRRFDFGFESGEGRPPLVADLTPESLSRMVKLQLELRVTIYGKLSK
jgi:hypothetical protein